MDGVLLSAVVRRHGQKPGRVSVLQGCQPRPARGLHAVNVTIDLPRLTSELETLARFSDAEPPAVTRVLFTRPDLEARAFFKKLAAEAGLAVREDPAGNLFARWVGREPSLHALGTGSHTDAIPFSGR